MSMQAKLLNKSRTESLYVSCGQDQSWQLIYRQLKLYKMPNVTSYQVNGNLYIIVPVRKEVKK